MLQNFLKKRTGKIITREIYNIKKLKINKYYKASAAAFKPINIKFNNFVFPNPFFWNPPDFFLKVLESPLSIL